MKYRIYDEIMVEVTYLYIQRDGWEDLMKYDIYPVRLVERYFALLNYLHDI